MKQAWDDLKSAVRIIFQLALGLVSFIAVFKSEDVFNSVFLLFTNLCTAVFTFFFTKKKEVTENTEKKEG